MRIYVIDASVVVKWFIEEQFSEKALSLRDDHVNGAILLHAPYLLIYEVMNALRYSQAFSEDELKKLGDAILNYRIQFHPPSTDFLSIAINVALSYNVTIYDSSYVALGWLLGADVITADEKLVKAVQHAVLPVSVISLSNLGDF